MWECLVWDPALPRDVPALLPAEGSLQWLRDVLGPGSLLGLLESAQEWFILEVELPRRAIEIRECPLLRVQEARVKNRKGKTHPSQFRGRISLKSTE